MMLFLFILLGLLWLFQVVFFGEIYKTVRISEIRSSAQNISRCVNTPDELERISKDTAENKQVCVLVFDERGKVLASEESLSDCMIHGMSAKNIYMLYAFAKDEGGEKLSRFRLEKRLNQPFVPDTYHASDDHGTDDDTVESIIYTKVIRDNTSGRDVAVILNTTVSPVSSTVRTLQTELIIITAIMILLAALLSFLLAKRIARPIVHINNSAKQLANGNYNADFRASGYREIAELSDTLAYAASELSKAGALQRELIANISHDLRTPLTMITGYAEAMRDIPGENTPENVQIIIDEANRLTSLVNDVLDISKLQSRTQELTLSTFNLTDTVREVIGRFSKLTSQDGWTIEFKSDCEVMVEADRNRILQVIYNFINNAITHSGANKTVTVTQNIVERDSKKKVRIAVTDYGEGIAAEEIPNIWDRYYKVDKLHRRAQMGSGLGLSIVKNILDLHGSAYGVESELGNGSTFWFEL
ncbi:MAG: HAMP domain-containing histidine kinase [Clostridia bacterium]|nr:HAMP domain-containing histidine kinase [Clostridia bacterium]